MALSVFALAAVGLTSLQSQSIATLASVERDTYAALVAQNLLVDLAAASAPTPVGVKSGDTQMGGRTWRWRVEVSPTLDPETRRVRALVFGTQGTIVAADLTGFIAAPQPGPPSDASALAPAQTALP